MINEIKDLHPGDIVILNDEGYEELSICYDWDQFPCDGRGLTILECLNGQDTITSLDFEVITCTGAVSTISLYLSDFSSVIRGGRVVWNDE